MLADIVARGTALRRALHREPELAHTEHDTAAVVRAELDRLLIPWRACAGTGTLAWLAQGAQGRWLGLRADIDALAIDELGTPEWRSRRAGVMHACGHDGHTASLLAAAAWLKRHEDRLPGPLTLLFQPAEEGGHGARAMIADGALDGIEEVYGWHNWPPLASGRAACPDGPVMSANGCWRAVIHGRGGHASEPARCIDPIVLGAALAPRLRALVPAGERSVAIATRFHAGSTDTAIPDQAELGGGVRAPTTQRRDAIADGIRRAFDGVCTAAGARCDFTWKPTYDATVNHPACAARARAALTGALGPEALTHDLTLPLLAAEDFSYYLARRPGAYFLLGSGRPGATCEPCHSPRFDFDDDLIPVAVRVWAAIAGAPPPG